MYNLIYNTTFSNNILQTLGPLPIYVLIFAIIYFVMIRPQARKQKEHNQMLDNLKKGDRVVTNGGIVGVIKNIKGKDNNILEIDSSNTKLEVLRTHISANKTN